jgi:hypothetical protein
MSLRALTFTVEAPLTVWNTLLSAKAAEIPMTIKVTTRIKEGIFFMHFTPYVVQLGIFSRKYPAYFCLFTHNALKAANLPSYGFLMVTAQWNHRLSACYRL